MPDDAPVFEPVQPAPPDLDPDTAHWLEMAEAYAQGDSYAAAADLAGNEIGAVVREIDGAIAFGLTAIDFWFFNRVVGMGVRQPATPDTLAAIEAFYAGLGLRQGTIHVANGAGPPDFPRLLAEGGWTQGSRWVKLWHDLSAIDPVREGPRVERIGPDRAQAYGDVVMAAFEMPEQVRPVATATIGRPAWIHYLGYEGETPVAAGAMHLRDGAAWLGYGATLEASRGRGWQTAMFVQRLHDARQAGCRLAVTETGEETEKDPVNHSYRNMLRTGFRLAYARRNWYRLS